MDNLIIVEHEGQRVMTSKQLETQGFGTETQLKQNFNNHSSRFKEGKQYFKLEGSELKEFKNKVDNIDLVGKRAKSLLLWTESGILRHAKILDSDMAWNIYEMLEDTYFKVKEQTQQQYKLPKDYKEALLEIVHQLEINEELETQNKELLKETKHKQNVIDSLKSLDKLSIEDKRTLVNLLVRQNSKNRNFGETWNLVYKEFNRKYHRNIKTCAKNRGKKPLDYVIDDLDMLNELVETTLMLFEVSEEELLRRIRGEKNNKQLDFDKMLDVHDLSDVEEIFKD